MDRVGLHLRTECGPIPSALTPALQTGVPRADGYGVDGVRLAWHRSAPELAFAANSISLLMPYVEPYIVRSVRAVLDDVDAPLRARAVEFMEEELAHHVEHRRFNAALAAECAGIRRVERWAARAYRWLGRTRSRRFNVAFAASSEAIAFAIARWVDAHVALLFDDADPEVADLYLWHLAEEVGHKSVAFDVFEAVDGSRRRYALTAAVSLALLVPLSFAGTMAMLVSTRRWRSPLAWLRLAGWSLSLAFTVLPMLASSCLPGHHPSALADPGYLVQWRRGRSAASATTPAPGSSPRSAGDRRRAPDGPYSRERSIRPADVGVKPHASM